MKILVIEDNAEIQTVIEYLLVEEGYEVVSWTDGSSLDSLYEIRPDLIVLDELLPDIKGSDLCRQIKSKSHTSHIPVLIISALSDVNKIAEDCGADAYVEKPFNIDTLTDTVKRLLTRP